MDRHQSFNKITDATVTQAAMGLIWIESAEPFRTEDGRELWYDFWMLIESATDRVMSLIDGPTSDQLTFRVEFDGGATRKFLSEEGAKRYALAMAINTLTEERASRSYARKFRRFKRTRK